MVVLWLMVTVLAAFLEGASAGLISLWFIFGGLAATILSLLGADIAVQIVVFIIVSVVSIIVLRPIIKKSINIRETKTNVDRLIGKHCLVTEDINNLKNTGEVLINGQRWSAQSADDETIIAVGEKVEVIDIRGVKLIIKQYKTGGAL